MDIAAQRYFFVLFYDAARSQILCRRLIRRYQSGGSGWTISADILLDEIRKPPYIYIYLYLYEDSPAELKLNVV
jgi:hypothetical protein